MNPLIKEHIQRETEDKNPLIREHKQNESASSNPLIQEHLQQEYQQKEAEQYPVWEGIKKLGSLAGTGIGYGIQKYKQGKKKLFKALPPEAEDFTNKISKKLKEGIKVAWNMPALQHGLRTLNAGTIITTGLIESDLKKGKASLKNLAGVAGHAANVVKNPQDIFNLITPEERKQIVGSWEENASFKGTLDILKEKFPEKAKNIEWLLNVTDPGSQLLPPKVREGIRTTLYALSLDFGTDPVPALISKLFKYAGKATNILLKNPKVEKTLAPTISKFSTKWTRAGKKLPGVAEAQDLGRRKIGNLTEDSVKAWLNWMKKAKELGLSEQQIARWEKVRWGRRFKEAALRDEKIREIYTALRGTGKMLRKEGRDLLEKAGKMEGSVPFKTRHGHVLGQSQALAKKENISFREAYELYVKDSPGGQTYEAIKNVRKLAKNKFKEADQYAMKKAHKIAVELGIKDANQSIKTMKFSTPKLKEFTEEFEKLAAQLRKDAGIDETFAFKNYIVREEMPELYTGGKPKSVMGSSRGFTKRWYGKTIKEAQQGKKKLASLPYSMHKKHAQVITAKVKDDVKALLIRKYGKDINPGNYKEYTTTLFKGTGKAKKVKTFIPERLLETFKELETTKADNIISKSLEYVTGLWKGSVTSLFPAFHARNFRSGMIFQNFYVIGSDAFNPKNYKHAGAIIAALKNPKFLKKMGKKTIKYFDETTKTYKTITYEKALKLIKKGYFLRRGEFGAGIGHDLSPATLLKSDKFAKFEKVLGRRNIGFRAGRELGNMTEDFQKLTVWWSEFRRTGNWKKAAQLAIDAGFDYGDITTFEKSLRKVFPFYTFTRKNLALQLKTMTKYPLRMSIYHKGMNALKKAFQPEEYQQYEKLLPEYIQQQHHIITGKDDEGKLIVVAGFGSPTEEFYSKADYKDALSMLNPAIKYLSETAMNRDIFFGKPIDEIKSAKPLSWLEKAPKAIQNIIGFHVTKKRNAITGEWEKKYTADPKALHILRNTMAARLVTEAGRFTDEDAELSASLIRYLTGVAIYKVDPDTLKYFKEEEAVDELLKPLERRGFVKDFTNRYAPKSVKMPPRLRGNIKRFLKKRTIDKERSFKKARLKALKRKK